MNEIYNETRLNEKDMIINQLKQTFMNIFTFCSYFILHIPKLKF